MLDTDEALLMSTGAAAKFLAIGRNQLYALIRNRKLPARMLNGRIRIAKSDLRAFVASLPSYTPGKAVKS